MFDEELDMLLEEEAEELARMRLYEACRKEREYEGESIDTVEDYCRQLLIDA